MYHREVFDSFVRSSTSNFSTEEISNLIPINSGPYPEKRPAVRHLQNHEEIPP